LTQVLKLAFSSARFIGNEPIETILKFILEPSVALPIAFRMQLNIVNTKDNDFKSEFVQRYTYPNQKDMYASELYLNKYLNRLFT
jgi:hypothetical protein